MGSSLPFGVFLVLATVLLTNANSTQESQHVMLTQQIEAERHALDTHSRLGPLAKQALQTFDDRFTAGAKGQEVALSRLFAVAQAAGLILGDGDYRQDEESTSKWGRYVATLPVKGSALAIQNFAAKALKDEPSLALASISVNRGRVSDAELEARLVFVLYYRKPV